MYSWVSLRAGLLGDCQLPQAVEVPAEEDLSQMISPRIRKPMSRRSLIMNAWSGMYGFLPRFAMFTQILPPGTRTLWVSFHTFLRNSRYSLRVRS